MNKIAGMGALHPLKISAATARDFLLSTHGFLRPFSGIAEALAHHGYIQIDPINVCGRMHDLILRNRVAGYREGDLMRYLHAAEHRRAFEHHLPHSSVLVAFPFDAWPHLDAAMQARTRRSGAWSGRLTPREKELAPRLLEEIAAHGPLGSADFDDPRRGRAVWGKSTLVKATLQKLFFHGRLLIAARVNNHRRYDLPGRVLPAAVLKQPPATPESTARWVAILKVRQYRLALLTKQEIAAAEGAIVPVEIEGCPQVWSLAGDAPAIDELRAQSLESRASSGDDLAQSSELRVQSRQQRAEMDPIPALSSKLSALSSKAPVRLLAPLDPLIYQRRLTSALWNFDYAWEVYTPPAKRVRGYYALPVLSGTEIVGHVDPKADRPARKLNIASRQIRRGHSVTPAIKDLARFLDCIPSK